MTGVTYNTLVYCRVNSASFIHGVNVLIYADTELE